MTKTKRETKKRVDRYTLPNANPRTPEPLTGSGGFHFRIGCGAVQPLRTASGRVRRPMLILISSRGLTTDPETAVISSAHPRLVLLSMPRRDLAGQLLVPLGIDLRNIRQDVFDLFRRNPSETPVSTVLEKEYRVFTRKTAIKREGLRKETRMLRCGDIKTSGLLVRHGSGHHTRKVAGSSPATPSPHKCS
jgi:hypothetical protein